MGTLHKLRLHVSKFISSETSVSKVHCDFVSKKYTKSTLAVFLNNFNLVFSDLTPLVGHREGRLAGRKLCDEVPVWLTVWSEVDMIQQMPSLAV